MKWLPIALLFLASTAQAQNPTLAIGQPDAAPTTSSNAQIWPGCASSCMSVNPGYVVIPGSVRKVWTNVCAGTNAWGGTGYPSEVAACTYPANLNTTQVVNSGNCTVASPTSIYFTLTCPSSISATELDSITVTTVATPTASVTFHVLVVVPAADSLGSSASMGLHTCSSSNGVATCVRVNPFYEVLYQGQYADLHAFVSGKINEKVTWAVSPSNGGLTIQNGSSNRSIALKGVNAGTYTVTATSVADGTATGFATIIVTGNSLSGQTRTSKAMPIDCTPEGSGTTYNVTDDTSFGAVPWSTLQPGDTVTIHAKAALAAYAIPFQIIHSGTPTQPIRVCGIPDGSGNLPILTGNLAGQGNVSVSQQPYGMVVIVDGPGFEHVQCSMGTNCSQPPEPDPHSIVVEGLKVVSAYQGYSRSGGAAAWGVGAGSFRVYGRQVVIRGNEMTDSSNGYFSDSQTVDLESRMNRDVAVEGNYIYNNGEVGGSSQHNAYVQGDNLVFQWNWVGLVRSGALGNSLKVRNDYAVIRYNYIQGSARVLDKVELQDWGDYGLPDYYYADNQPSGNPTDPISIADVAVVAEHLEEGDYVYGNVMDNDALLGNSSYFAIHYFNDVFGAYTETGGTMYFYGNTFRDIHDLTGTYGTGINMFDQDRTGALPSVWPNIRLTNNAIDLECATAMCANGQPEFSFAVGYQDIDAIDKNWITTGWNTTALGSGPSPAWSACCQSPSNNGATCYQNTCTDANAGNNISGTGNLITGSSVPFNSTTFIPPGGSPLLSATTALPSAVSDMPPEFNYEPDNQAISLRPDLSGGAPTTIGALGNTGVGAPTIPAPSRSGLLLARGQ